MPAKRKRHTGARHIALQQRLPACFRRDAPVPGSIGYDRRVGLFKVTGRRDKQGCGGILYRIVHPARRKVHIHHPKVVGGVVGRV